MLLQVYVDQAHHASKAFRAHAVQSFTLSAAFVAVRADAKVTICVSRSDGVHLGVAWSALGDLLRAPSSRATHAFLTQ